jgi:hypothetical protein
MHLGLMVVELSAAARATIDAAWQGIRKRKLARALRPLTLADMGAESQRLKIFHGWVDRQPSKNPCEIGIKQEHVGRPSTTNGYGSC